MNLQSKILPFLVIALLFAGCNNNDSEVGSSASSGTDVVGKGQSAVVDDASQKDIVKVASGSKDHTTLVKAIVSADLVNALSNAGPFTVFAPTNEAFNKLPAGTLDGLLKEDKKNDLQNVLQYHVSVGVFKTEMLNDGKIIGQVNGDNITLTNKGGKIMVNGVANVIASIPASNGIIHVIDAVLLPPQK